MKEERPLRLFIALELPPEARLALGRTVDTLRASGVASLRWMAAENIHLTLKFLGDVTPHRVPELGDALAAAAKGHAPFTLHLAEGGVFPSIRAPQVVWVGLQGDLAALKAVQTDVAHSLAEMGFPVEARPFVPHLTVARARGRLSADERTRLASVLQQMEAADQHAFPIEKVSLVKSTLLPSGAVYDHLLQFPLATPL